MIEVLKQMVEALEVDAYVYNGEKSWAAIKAGKQAIKELESQEPVAWEQFHGHMAGPFYQEPPQRTWVGLTNDELTDLFYNTNLGQASAVAQAIELLKEKNT